MDVISGPQKRELRTPEFWHEVKQLVERGLSLKKVSQRFGLCWSSLVHRAQREGWKLCYSGRPRSGDYAESVRRREQAALEQRRQEEAQATLEHEASVLVIDVRKAELLTEKVLKGHSVRLKIALSEWAVKTAEKLRASEGRLRDEAAAMLAIKAIGNQLYGWDKEPDLERMKLAHKGGDERPTAAVNLALINTSPAQLAQMAKAKSDHSGDHVGDHNGDRCGEHSSGRNVPSATECNGLSLGPSAIAPEQPGAATHGRPVPKKEAPTSRTLTGERMAPPLAPEQPVKGDPSSPAAQAQAARLEALEQARAEHRRACRIKYG